MRVEPALTSPERLPAPKPAESHVDLINFSTLHLTLGRPRSFVYGFSGGAMHACQRMGRGCSVHRAQIDRVKQTFIVMLVAQYGKQEIRRIKGISDRLMLDETRGDVLDDQDEETLDLAAREAPKWKDFAEQYLRLLNG